MTNLHKLGNLKFVLIQELKQDTPNLRLGQEFYHLSHESDQGDRDAMSLAELWLVTREHKETVYKHRMLGRLPSQVNLREDARHPEFLNNAKLIDISKCNNFDWYLQHVREASHPARLHSKFRRYSPDLVKTKWNC
jgi:hypothetical protein